MNVRVFQCSLLASFVVLLAACAWDAPQSKAPESSQSDRLGRPLSKPVTASVSSHDRAINVALEQLGRPYRYGGASPAGFDCSGLIWYAFSKVGINVPRTTQLLWQQLPAVPNAQLSRGDILFFDIEGKPSHVGLYLGDGRFVHAPSTGKAVTTESLSHVYYAPRLLKIGRIKSP